MLRNGCFTLRKASRAVTQMFDESLQPTGLRSTQLSLLALLAGDQKFTMGELADALVVSPSTLSRNLRPLARDGYIEIRREGNRHKTVILTEHGRAAVASAAPHWEQAQRKFLDLIGESSWDDLFTRLEDMLSAVRTNGGGSRRSAP